MTDTNMELIMQTPEESFLKAIVFNKEDLKKALAVRIEKYKGLTYTDDQIKDAKEDRATLNKFKAAMEDARKKVKTRVLEPYNAFEKDIKELVGMVDEPLTAIDTHIKTDEEKKKAAKKEKIVQFYAESCAAINKLIPLDALFNQQWLNATFAMSKVEDELTERMTNIEAALKGIDALNSDFKPQIKDHYLKTFDLAASLQEGERLKEQKERLAAYEQTKKAEVPKVVDAGTPGAFENAQPGDTVRFGGPGCVSAGEQTLLTKIDFRVWVTPEQSKALREFLISNKIKYGKAN